MFDILEAATSQFTYLPTYVTCTILCEVHFGINVDTTTRLSKQKVLKLTCFFPHLGLLCDLLWSDPDKEVRGWGENDRGVSFTFGPDIVTKFNNRNDLDLVCRAHQVCTYVL